MINTTNLQLKKPTDTDNADLTIFVGDNMQIIDNVIGNNNSLITTSKEVVGAINELFTCASNGKDEIAIAITGKGVQASGGDTFNALATKISQIPSSGGSNSQSATKLNVVAPYTKTFTLTNSIIDYQVLYNVREFIISPEVTNLICDFNNGDSGNFVDTNGKVIFDGAMHLSYLVSTNDMTNLGSLGVGTEWKYAMSKSNFNSIDSLSFTDATIPKVVVNGTNPPYVVKAQNDIDLSGIDTLDGIIFNTTTTNGGKMLLAMSVDGGVTYKSYNPTTLAWDVVDINNVGDFTSKGMNKIITDGLTKTQLEVLRNGSTRLRFAYYLSVVDSTSTASTSSISIVLQMQGSYVLANNSDYGITIGGDNKTVNFNFSKSSTYTIKIEDN